MFCKKESQGFQFKDYFPFIHYSSGTVYENPSKEPLRRIWELGENGQNFLLSIGYLKQHPLTQEIKIYHDISPMIGPVKPSLLIPYFGVNEANFDVGIGQINSVHTQQFHFNSTKYFDVFRLCWDYRYNLAKAFEMLTDEYKVAKNKTTNTEKLVRGIYMGYNGGRSCMLDYLDRNIISNQDAFNNANKVVEYFIGNKWQELQ